MSTSQPVLVPFFEKKDKFVFEQESSSEVGNINFHENIPKKEEIKQSFHKISINRNNLMTRKENNSN